MLGEEKHANNFPPNFSNSRRSIQSQQDDSSSLTKKSRDGSVKKARKRSQNKKFTKKQLFDKAKPVNMSLNHEVNKSCFIAGYDQLASSQKNNQTTVQHASKTKTPLRNRKCESMTVLPISRDDSVEELNSFNFTLSKEPQPDQESDIRKVTMEKIMALQNEIRQVN